MPVSHLGLTVCHIPSATSFYLGALQPLGYRYIGCQGDSVGLGIDDADFFITQGPRSSYIAPTHIAFAADDRTQVRNCYTSALSAGGRPSGPPGYRNHECSCFNAAVEDLDGNTIEFIFRENGPCDAKPSHADEEKSRVLTWQEGVSKEADAASVASKAESKAPTEAPSEKAPSEKAPTVAEPEPAAEAAPASDGGILSALSSGITGKNVLGGVIGAVAVGAVGYAFYRSEQDSARAEAAHEALMASYERGRIPSARPPAYAPGMKRSMSAAAPRTARTFRNYAPTESIGPDPRQHRNFSVTESRVGPRPPPTQVPTQAPTAMKAIEARAYDRDSEIQSVLSKHTSRHPQTEYRALEAPGDYYDDDEIQTVLSRHTSRHPEEMRAIEAGSKAPTMVSRRTSHRALEGARSEAPTMMSRRSSHAPQEPRAIEAARSEAPTMASRRSSHAPQSSRALEDARSEAPTTLSKHTSRRSQALRALDMDSEVQAATSRMTNRRPQVARSQTFDASVYSPMPSSVGSAGDIPTRAPPKRSATLHDDPTAHSRLYLEGPKELMPSSKSLRSGRGEYSEAGRSEGGASKVSHRSSRRDVKDDDEKSQASTVRHIKPDGSRYEGSRHEGSRYEGSKHGSSRHEGSTHESKHEGSEHGRSRHEGSRHGSSQNDGASRNGLSRDPDGLSDASTIKASRRDSAAHIPSPASKAAAKVSRATAAEYRLPDSPVPSYYYPPSEAPKPVAREPVQPSPMQNGPQAFRPASHQTVLQPTQAQAVYAPPPAARRASHASGSAAGVPLPSSLASGRGYEDVEDSDGLGDIKTVVPDDSISCIDLSKPKAPRSDVSRQSERSHRSHRTHHSSRSKHSHRHDDEKSRVAIDAQTVVPEDSISSVGSKPARSEHSHHTHRSSRDDKKSHHSSRSKHSKSHEKEEEKEADDATVYLDARTVLPEDSISSVGAPDRSEHSHHSHHSSRDDKKSHHSSRSKHSKSHDEDKEKKHRKEGRTDSEAGRSDVTVKPAKAKSLLSAMTLPGRLKGDKEEKKKRSVASYA